MWLFKCAKCGETFGPESAEQNLARLEALAVGKLEVLGRPTPRMLEVGVDRLNRGDTVDIIWCAMLDAFIGEMNGVDGEGS